MDLEIQEFAHSIQTYSQTTYLNHQAQYKDLLRHKSKFKNIINLVDKQDGELNEQPEPAPVTLLSSAQEKINSRFSFASPDDVKILHSERNFTKSRRSGKTSVLTSTPTSCS
ncbi:hypothetical protein PR048_030354 [Dryococelus australis]|uniref:Uncharacterized protein n=1 Tax=Dryococelus australis TaxID=614101 RepID=A0ABQ9GBL4_9NEOP|nr:hypothetical protein PR048_030354 [Dryococelus australis]